MHVDKIANDGPLELVQVGTFHWMVRPANRTAFSDDAYPTWDDWLKLARSIVAEDDRLRAEAEPPVIKLNAPGSTDHLVGPIDHARELVMAGKVRAYFAFTFPTDPNAYPTLHFSTNGVMSYFERLGFATYALGHLTDSKGSWLSLEVDDE